MKMIGSEEQRMELYHQGLSDSGVANKVGCCSSAISYWRVRRKLLSNLEKTHELEKRRIESLIEKPTKDFGYFCGLIAGDGGLSYTADYYRITLNTSKEELIYSFRQLVNNLFPFLYIYQVQSVGCQKLNIHCKPLYQILKKYKPKPYRWFIPEFLNGESLIGFLQGIFDTDGNAPDRHPHIPLQLSSKFKENLIPIAKILRNWGIELSVVQSGNGWAVRIFGKYNHEKFRRKIGFRLSEKGQKLDMYIDTGRHMKNKPTPFKKVEKLIPKMKEMRERGCYYREIAEILNLSYATVYYGINGRAKKNQFDDMGIRNKRAITDLHFIKQLEKEFGG